MLYLAIMMVIKSLVGLLALRVQAFVLPPSSFALLSQFMTFAGLVTNIASATVTTGMTVLLARARTEKDGNQLIQSGKYFAALVSTLISVACLYVFYMGGESIGVGGLPSSLFLVLSLSPWLITRSSITQARLTSSFYLSRFTNISNGSAIAVALIIIVLTYFYGLNGSAIAVAIGPMLAAGLLLFFGSNKIKPTIDLTSEQVHSGQIAELIRFSCAMLIAVCAVPIAQMLARGAMVTQGASEQAGYWSASVRLSDAYMQFFGLLIMAYVLPIISAQRATDDVRRVFVHYLLRLALLAFALTGMVFVFRELIVWLVLAPEYNATVGLLRVQLPADFFRMLLSFFFWFAYGQNLRALAAGEEVLQACLFYIFFRFVFDATDASGVVMAHLFASVINASITGALLWLSLRGRPNV